MKAFRFHRHGGPEVLQFEDVAVAEPGRGELRIRNTAIAVNFRDVLVRRGTHAVKSFPSGIGVESAGVIEAVGPEVAGFAVGQRVVCVAGPDAAYAGSGSSRLPVPSCCPMASTSAPPPR